MEECCICDICMCPCGYVHMYGMCAFMGIVLACVCVPACMCMHACVCVNACVCVHSFA